MASSRVWFSLGLLVVAGCSGKYVRPTTSEVIQSTPDRLSRGSYLVNQAMSCGACHTTRDSMLSGERADMYLAGSVFDLPSEGWKFWTPNLTPDVETGLGGWSDDEIMRAIRDGIGKDGHMMIPLMPFSSYQHLSDEDLRSIVAYLRSVPPIKHARTMGENQLGFFAGFMINRGVMHHKPTRGVPQPSRSDKLKYGEYVMRLGDCWTCHSMGSMGPRDKDEEGFLSGSDRPDVRQGVGKVYFRNLTPDLETGLGKYSAEQIKAAIREGKRLDGKPMAMPMNWFIPHISGLTDEDLDALVAYLKSVPPYAKKIPERQLEPAYEKALSAH